MNINLRTRLQNLALDVVFKHHSVDEFEAVLGPNPNWEAFDSSGVVLLYVLDLLKEANEYQDPTLEQTRLLRLVIERGSPIGDKHIHRFFRQNGRSSDELVLLIENFVGQTPPEEVGAGLASILDKSLAIFHEAFINISMGYIQRMNVPIALEDVAKYTHRMSDFYGPNITHVAIGIFEHIQQLPGFDINSLDEDGNTPLMKVRHADIAQWLISNGARTDIRNHAGAGVLLTVWSHGAEAGVAKVLLANGADINTAPELTVLEAITDPEGEGIQSVLLAARRKQALEIISTAGHRPTVANAPKF